jgi:hypothetical protein
MSAPPQVRTQAALNESNLASQAPLPLLEAAYPESAHPEILNKKFCYFSAFVPIFWPKFVIYGPRVVEVAQNSTAFANRFLEVAQNLSALINRFVEASEEPPLQIANL